MGEAIGDPMSCADAVQLRPTFRTISAHGAPRSAAGSTAGLPDYAWTDLTYLLHASHVSWGYYVMEATSPTARTLTMRSDAADEPRRRASESVPLLRGAKRDGELGNIRDLSAIFMWLRKTGRCRRSSGSTRRGRTASIRRRW